MAKVEIKILYGENTSIKTKSQYSQKKSWTKVDKMIKLIRFEMDLMVGSRRKQEYV